MLHYSFLRMKYESFFFFSFSNQTFPLVEMLQKSKREKNNLFNFPCLQTVTFWSPWVINNLKWTRGKIFVSSEDKKKITKFQFHHNWFFNLKILCDRNMA